MINIHISGCQVPQAGHTGCSGSAFAWRYVLLFILASAFTSRRDWRVSLQRLHIWSVRVSPIQQVKGSSSSMCPPLLAFLTPSGFFTLSAGGKKENQVIIYIDYYQRQADRGLVATHYASSRLWAKHQKQYKYTS